LCLEQQEIAKEKAGAPLTWEDTRKMKYTWRVCQETMRLQPPAPLAFRRAIKDFEYEGHTIPKGWLVSSLFTTLRKLQFHEKLTLLVVMNLYSSKRPCRGGMGKEFVLKLSFPKVKIALSSMMLAFLRE